jgi:hypothetical protein
MVHAQSDRVLYVQHILKGARRVETTPKPHLVSSYRIFCPRDMVPGKDLGIAKCFEKDGEEFIETKGNTTWRWRCRFQRCFVPHLIPSPKVVVFG